MFEKTTVPLTFFDVTLFLGLWVLVQFFLGSVAGVVDLIIQPQAHIVVEADAGADVDREGHKHPLERLIEKSKTSPFVLLVAFFAVVVTAPLIEEFLFRLLFQGWLEAKLLQYQVFGASGVAIFIVSLCFAAIHAGESSNLSTLALLVVFIAFSIVYLPIFAMGIVYLVKVRNTKVTDILFGTERLSRPKLCAIAGCCLLVLLLCFGLTALLDWHYPTMNTDPIPIFFFSLALGMLYSITRNLSYCVLLHVCLNGTSLTILWLTAFFSG